jgi:hypothetical protein
VLFPSSPRYCSDLMRRPCVHPHAEPDELNAIKGELFPTCQYCGEGRGRIVDNAFNVASIEQFQV